MEKGAPARIKVAIDPDLVDLAAGFLANRRQDVERLRESLNRGDIETVRIIGHSMKGSGGGYGFDRISELGGALEQAAGRRDAAALVRLTGLFSDYLERIEVVID